MRGKPICLLTQCFGGGSREEGQYRGSKVKPTVMQTHQWGACLFTTGPGQTTAGKQGGCCRVVRDWEIGTSACSVSSDLGILQQLFLLLVVYLGTEDNSCPGVVLKLR